MHYPVTVVIICMYVVLRLKVRPVPDLTMTTHFATAHTFFTKQIPRVQIYYLSSVLFWFQCLSSSQVLQYITVWVFQEPLCVMFCRELRFAITCGGSTKPLVPKGGRSPDEGVGAERENGGLPFMPLTGFSSVTTKDNYSWQEEGGGAIPLEPPPPNDEQVKVNMKRRPFFTCIVLV